MSDDPTNGYFMKEGTEVLHPEIRPFKPAGDADDIPLAPVPRTGAPHPVCAPAAVVFHPNLVTVGESDGVEIPLHLDMGDGQQFTVRVRRCQAREVGVMLVRRADETDLEVPL